MKDYERIDVLERELNSLKERLEPLIQQLIDIIEKFSPQEQIKKEEDNNPGIG